MSSEQPIEWVVNAHAAESRGDEAFHAVIPPGIDRLTRAFHSQIPGYRVSPLKSLRHLASMIGLGNIWVKDESQRLSLNSFKVLGGSYAIYRYLKKRLGADDREMSFAELVSPEVKQQLGDITFATATDGNHGRGVAWAASKLGQQSVIYVHKKTSRARIRAIESYGAVVKVIDGNYDDAVHQVTSDAGKNGWQLISDTSWEGYEEIPVWVMQGYTTLYSEAQEQLAAQGLIEPTHLFVQAGVGALAAAGIGYYHGLLGDRAPHCTVIEPTQAACLYESARIGDGQPHTIEGELDTIMAGLACGEPNPLAWKVLWSCADVFGMCPDYVAGKGMRVYGMPLEGDPPITSGESAGVTLGALMFIMQHPEAKPLREQMRLGPSSEVLLLNCEGNTDPNYFRQVVWEGADAVPKKYRFRPVE